MKIRNGHFEEYGGFELDASKIELHSTAKDAIILPYHGAVPEELEGNVQSASIKIDATPVYGDAQAMLFVNVDGEKRHHLVDILHHEAVEILDKFYELDQTGLDDYWHGTARTAYCFWREFTEMPIDLTDLLSGISRVDYDLLISRVERRRKNL